MTEPKFKEGERVYLVPEMIKEYEESTGNKLHFNYVTIKKIVFAMDDDIPIYETEELDFLISERSFIFLEHFKNKLKEFIS